MVKHRATATHQIRNRKARYRFELLETFECGLVLTGTEVKSLRARQGSLEESYARFRSGELWLFGCHIPPYACGNVHNHDPLRPRKLLLHKREMQKLAPKLALRGLTLVPIDIHFNARGVAKVTLALARGKKLGDKREDLKRRQAQRDIERAMRRR